MHDLGPPYMRFLSTDPGRGRSEHDRSVVRRTKMTGSSKLELPFPSNFGQVGQHGDIQPRTLPALLFRCFRRDLAPPSFSMTAALCRPEGVKCGATAAIVDPRLSSVVIARHVIGPGRSSRGAMKSPGCLVFSIGIS